MLTAWCLAIGSVHLPRYAASYGEVSSNRPGRSYGMGARGRQLRSSRSVTMRASSNVLHHCSLPGYAGLKLGMSRPAVPFWMYAGSRREDPQSTLEVSM
jgi:hypothetical protein